MIVRNGWAALAVFCAFSWSAATSPAVAQVVPGTGMKLTEVGDDFEDPEWAWTANEPKSTSHIDGRVRRPIGQSSNGRWYESSYRGQPDLIKIVDTPEGGLEGSEKSLLLQSYYTALPGRTSNHKEANQDDLMLNVRRRLGGYQPVSRSPNCLVRVYLPPFDKWQQSPGAHFGLRADVFGRRGRDAESSWPGIFIQFHPAASTRDGKARASLILRGREYGDYMAKQIDQAGWWTLGMSFTPDGRAHYYASPGVDPLTAEDLVASHYPYSFRVLQFHSFYFNIFNPANGRAWSTPFIIDDPEMYIVVE